MKTVMKGLDWCVKLANADMLGARGRGERSSKETREASARRSRLRMLLCFTVAAAAGVEIVLIRAVAAVAKRTIPWTQVAEPR